MTSVVRPLTSVLGEVALGVKRRFPHDGFTVADAVPDVVPRGSFVRQTPASDGLMQLLGDIFNISV